MKNDHSGISRLGFGMMRLPKEGDVFDVEQIKAMVDAFLGAGFSYFDTAWAYPGSEEVIRQILVDRHPRESFQLATKMAAWRAKTREEALAQFATSLDRTGAGYFDFYLLHNLGEQRTQSYEDFGVWDFVRDLKREGRVKNFGFSFHSSADELDAILTAHPDVDFVQLQINWADWESPAIQSRKCFETARRHGKPVVIMEPVKGGLLAKPPQSVLDILKKGNPDRSPAAWALRFAASLEGVLTVLSGMSTLGQVEENLRTMSGFVPMSDEELDVIKKAQAELASLPVIPCTSCDYCADVCPMDIGISGSFSALNTLTLYKDMTAALHNENWLVAMHQRKRANECVQCGACEEICPQHIDIRAQLERVCEELSIS